MRRFLAPLLPTPAQPVTLSGAASHHLLRVAGIAPGEPVELFDGSGQLCLATLLRVEEGQATLQFHAPLTRPSPPERWLLVGQLKGPAFDQVVRMATELGVDHLWPLHLERTVALGDRRDRWERIAESAAAQCGRATLPAFASPQRLAPALAALPAGVAGRVFVPGAETAAAISAPAALLLGPEGGLSDAEVEQALEAGFVAVGLGPLTLRADTAVVAALARLLP